jgi:hypothetical protein
VSQTDEVTDRLTPGSPRGKPTGPADFGEPVTLAHLDITEHDGVVQALPSATPERRWATPQLDRTGSVPLPAHGVEDHGATPGTSPSKQRRYVKQPPDLSALEAHHAPKAYPAIDDFASHLTVGDIEADVVTVEDIKADVVTVEDIEAAVVRDLQDIRVVPDLILSAVRVSVVLPTLNEAANLPYVFERMPREAHEVILVDGHSPDGTVETAQQLWPGLVTINQSGRGKGNALACGFWAATGDVVVWLDADGSTDPAHIRRFVAALLAGADFAKGSRFIAGAGSADITRLRRAGNTALTKLVNRLWGTYFTDITYGYNAFWRHHLPQISPPSEGFEGEIGTYIRAARAGLRVHDVPSFEHDRRHGTSNLNARRDGIRVLRTIIAESVKPR